MKVLFKLSLVGLLIGLGCFAIINSGLVEHFDNVINEKDGWTQSEDGVYQKQVQITIHWEEAVILADPNNKEIKIYEDHIKKSFTDQLSLIGFVRVEVEDRNDGNYSKDQLRQKFKNEAKKYGANVVAIQNSGSYHDRVEVQIWNF